MLCLGACWGTTNWLRLSSINPSRHIIHNSHGVLYKVLTSDMLGKKCVNNFGEVKNIQVVVYREVVPRPRNVSR